MHTCEAVWVGVRTQVCVCRHACAGMGMGLHTAFPCLALLLWSGCCSSVFGGRLSEPVLCTRLLHAHISQVQGPLCAWACGEGWRCYVCVCVCLRGQDLGRTLESPLRGHPSPFLPGCAPPFTKAACPFQNPTPSTPELPGCQGAMTYTQTSLSSTPPFQLPLSHHAWCPSSFLGPLCSAQVSTVAFEVCTMSQHLTPHLSWWRQTF